jgi:hypothetical protein
MQSGHSTVPLPGGSVSDPDRGADTYVLGSSTPAGDTETIGQPDWRTQEAPPSRVVEEPVVPAAPPTAAAPGRLYAGPPVAGLAVTDPDVIRGVQIALASRGYFSGPLDGKSDAALTDALRRFQVDQSLPGTGVLDGETARRLGVVMPKAVPPRAG